MKKCTACGHENADNAKKCERCKAALPHGENNKTDEPVKVSKKKRSE